jgi:hypothetical protein
MPGGLLQRSNHRHRIYREDEWIYWDRQGKTIEVDLVLPFLRQAGVANLLNAIQHATECRQRYPLAVNLGRLVQMSSMARLRAMPAQLSRYRGANFSTHRRPVLYREVETAS